MNDEDRNSENSVFVNAPSESGVCSVIRILRDDKKKTQVKIGYDVSI